MNPPRTFATAAAELEAKLAQNPLIRAVNFHNTARERADHFEDQLQRLSRAFSSVNEAELDRYLATGRWDKPKPGVIVAVYEGYRNGFDVLVPLLERYGLVGWFFVITGFVNAPPSDQLAFAEAHDIEMATREYPDGRYALSWPEIRALDRHHVVACHTRSHVPLEALPDAMRESEVVGAQRDMEEHLQHPVRSFVAYGGAPYGEDPVTDRLVRAAGYQFVFSNLQIQRIRD